VAVSRQYDAEVTFQNSTVLCMYFHLPPTNCLPIEKRINILTRLKGLPFPTNTTSKEQADCHIEMVPDFGL
jgi:hypothetical protein